MVARSYADSRGNLLEMSMVSMQEPYIDRGKKRDSMITAGKKLVEVILPPKVVLICSIKLRI